jgi:SPP1 family predicted phage head-tail adaptor
MKCCDITAGTLRHRIKIQRQTYTPDGLGGGANTWSDYAEIRAFIKPKSGNEKLYSMRLESEVTHRIFIRYRDDLTTTDRINFNGRLMQIRALINIEEANRFIEIYADEGVAT